jgi:uncharacterized DUF497 family protein
VEFEWDATNIRHMAGHGVTREEYEQAFAVADWLYEHLAGDELRQVGIGHTRRGRVLFVI